MNEQKWPFASHWLMTLVLDESDNFNALKCVELPPTRTFQYLWFKNCHCWIPLGIYHNYQYSNYQIQARATSLIRLLIEMWCNRCIHRLKNISPWKPKILNWKWWFLFGFWQVGLSVPIQQIIGKTKFLILFKHTPYIKK